ncbi:MULTISPECIES: ATP-dependent zinc metalloprotease FtsH [unclassified Modicisalibacter]|uniref:ATP-dependent zinc metalloprotease FtsH n=1 Tax=unclassified Modicisalibacter TaxID=2679913 RepID=UPI001CCDA0FF|nr:MULTISPECIES: ATP-dependent zinc metalloprotease FtsH [unclassified Modicisalibacter]MBZ9558806.1 ATP-dependent zinc metalloprotease FtsH [Modicisalibacter sp. R2A 31.J]MBZ9575303.1 ATP-dependent zinc metalloprotease FtsH [Modicisalibacter sp. MOD 31.J]
MDKRNQIHLWYVIVAFVMVLLIQDAYLEWRSREPIPYSEFTQRLEAGDIATVKIGSEQITGTFKTAQDDGRTGFTTNRVDPALAATLEKYSVTFDGTRENTFLSTLLSWLIPVLFFFALWSLVIRRMANGQGLGGMMTLGKSKAKVYVETATKVTFADVAGVDEAKDELKEVVAFLRDPQRYGRLGAHVPKGILLVGPPGTGKTLLARAVAGEAGVPFFSISGSEFVEMFVGVGAARVRDLFEQAGKAKPCIVFIDELDALGRARGPNAMGGHDEKEQTLNQLLTELDGFDTASGIVLLAATNRPEILDPALLRAGRFDRQVLVDRPERAGRKAILMVHIGKIQSLAEDVDLDHLAALTPGFTGADLANLVNEAALLATRREADAVSMADFTNAIERIVAGLEKKSRLLNPHEREVVAHHEMGHALVAAALPGMDPVHKVSIIPRGVGALGYTIQRPTEDRFLQTTHDLENRMAVLMGGRAAERLIFDEISTGAADDLAKVTEIARHMVTRFGMADDVEQVVYEEDRHAFLGDNYGLAQPRSYSEATGREIDLAVRGLVDGAYRQALRVLEAALDDLRAGAALLLERETLTAQDFPPIQPMQGRDGGKRHAPASAGQATSATSARR